jgi:tRNA A37 threonylcarbamoyladenosine modification protein TsaB
MTLYIDTTEKEKMIISLFEKRGSDFYLVSKSKISAYRSQSEKLLPGILKLLKKNNLKLSDLKLIVVKNNGGSFTSLRIGVVTANALAYGLDIKARAGYLEKDKLILKKERLKKFSKYNIVEPRYSSNPNIT